MSTASVRPIGIHRAMPFFGIQELTVAAASSGQRKNTVFEIEVVNQPRLAEALGNLLGLLVLGFKGVDQAQTNEVGHLDFNGHGAAVGCTRITHAGFVTGPTVEAIDINDASR